MLYSHQRFTFTVSRISSNVLLNVVLPFMLVTTLTGVSASLGSAESRLQVISTIFMSAVGLRYVSSQYIPKVSYATFLDQYMWACLLFIAAAALLSMLSGNSVIQSSTSAFYYLQPPWNTFDSLVSGKGKLCVPNGCASFNSPTLTHCHTLLF